MPQVDVSWNTAKKTGTAIRKLNGGNLAPFIANENAGWNIRKSFKELNLAFARLHDSPLSNPGCRLVDISHIFPLPHLDENDCRNYDFSYTDDYIRNCIEGSDTPIYYRLGESIDHSVRKYKTDPPADVDKWINICSNIIRHYTEGLWNGFKFNIKYWEIWNEPDAKEFKMWRGTLAQFNEFYVKVATELKKRFPHLMIGGPAHTKFNEINVEFVKHCAANKAPLDFYSYHCYSPDPYGWIQETPALVRKLLDENGYTNTEIHLNEWHYFPGEWARLRNDPVYKDHMYNDEMKGMDSAAFLTTVMALWQDTPLDYGAYYTCIGNAWGCYKTGGNIKTPSWYGLKAFGDIVRYPVRLKASSSMKEVTVLAGENENGDKAMLLSAFKTRPLDVEVQCDIPVSAGNCQVLLLDNDHQLTPVEEVTFEDNKIKFSFIAHSACALIKLSSMTK
ncbi:MAG: hypothetical protein IJY46_11505 [Lentisphaeria bacterium]|nr:hypothetical protein [Lentisphaeria bacterium]